ncbi:beta-galactosidase [Paenibacillus sp. MMS20-IR301]|uniref:beta-galactosidase n=1 Tax=Paenibacillus sp. MMS20-IR301 TaxID=2895946 RepID=UPI0028EBA487|nr:beta-galactosidase [Paenibacillus sp. MMS20-IR301]WNS41367.1 beta-galactosidase [Paenibacillus sp. MMS20-IR301]
MREQMKQAEPGSYSKVQIGVDYYPEHWEEAMWEPDIKLMKETGVKVVRVAEFAWSRLEPVEGRFDFAWLDRALDLFHAYGIQVVIGTPTTTPPRWLTTACPDVLPVFADGSVYHPGVRGHRCYNSASLRTYGSRIIEALARRYSSHPAVIGWQTDNEFGMLDCHCDSCNRAFRSWVQAKYSTLERLNSEWGTVVWSGEYSSWEELTVPYGGSPHQNPSLLLDFQRFQWDSCIHFQRRQTEILRAVCPERFITHNFHSYPQRLDMHGLAEDLDVASFDYYPNPAPQKQATAPYSGALSLDLTRGLKRRNFWIMEQLSGPPGCWFPMWRTPHPGLIRAYAWQAIARGADTVVHFRWRSAAAGAEQFWHGLIDHSNVPGRRFAEFAQLCGEVNALAPLLEGTEVTSNAAILYSHEQMAALRIQPQADGLDYYDNIKQYHRALTKLGISCDVIDWRQPLEGYKLAIVPSLYLHDEEAAQRLESFAGNGGTVILTNRSGVKNMNNICLLQPLPGLFSRAAGVTVAEYDPVGHDIHMLVDAAGESFECSQWCDILQPEEAEPVAWYGDDFFAGSPAVTVNRFGAGKVYYIGTHASEAYWLKLLGGIAAEAGLAAFPDLPDGVQAFTRTGEKGELLFLLNLSRGTQSIGLDKHYRSALSGSLVSGIVELSPFAVEILETGV